MYYIQYEKAEPHTATGVGFVVDPQSMVDALHDVSEGKVGDIPSDFMIDHQPQYNYVNGQLVRKE